LTACKQASHWRNEETLWAHTLAITSHNQWAEANYAYLLLRKERPREAIPHFEASLAIWRGDAQIHRMYALALLQVGSLGAAIREWEAVLETEPHDTNAEANLAWVWATSPQESMRHGAKAALLIEDVIAQSGRENASVLRTCAAAYAESGRFADAIETAKEATQLALDQGNSTLVADLGEDIRGYQKSVPLRDPSLADIKLPPRRQLPAPQR
jgi:tetratricopeptide (TPR) repeat protein